MSRDLDADLELAVVMGLRKGLSLCHGMRRQLTEPEQFRIAARIIEHLRLANYRIASGPPVEAHGAGYGVAPPEPTQHGNGETVEEGKTR